MKPQFIITLLLISQLSVAQSFRFSEGIYRVPYANGTTVSMGSDVWSHNPPGKYDMGGSGSDPVIVAAADGWVRGIQESFDTSCFTVVNNVVSCCWQLNNYVIIEHPNGEFSGYTHMQVGSTSDQGIALNQWVNAGTPIGLEGTVGCSTGDHLHFEVSRPADVTNGFQSIGGFLNGELLIPVICGIGTDESFFRAGNDYVAGPCNDNCVNLVTVENGLNNSEENVWRGDLIVQTELDGGHVFANGSVSQFRALANIRIRPGFTIASGARFEAIITSCNQ